MLPLQSGLWPRLKAVLSALATRGVPTIIQAGRATVAGLL